MEEFWDLFDDNRVFLNKQCRRGDKIAAGENHIIIEVWTVNSAGELLLTLRHPDKREYANKWEDTGGCAMAGESSRQATVRELFEERGIAARKEELIFLGTVKESTSFTDIYMLHRDVSVDALRLCEGETMAAKWVTLKVLDSMIADESLALYAGRRLCHVRKEFEKHIKAVSEALPG